MIKIYEKRYQLCFLMVFAQNLFSEVHDIVEDQNIEIQIVDDKFVTTPLHTLVVQQFDDKKEKIEKITELLREGADVNAQNEDHRTPLWLITFYGGDIDLITLLIEYGADVTIPDVFNETPLHNLVDRNDTQAASLLLDAAAVMNSDTVEKMMTFKNDAQETPLEITKTPEMDEALLTGELLHEVSLSQN